MLSCWLYFRWFFFSSRRRHTRLQGDWSSDVCSSDLDVQFGRGLVHPVQLPDDGRIEDRNRGSSGLRDGALNRQIGYRLAEGAQFQGISRYRSARGDAGGRSRVGCHRTERAACAGGSLCNQEGDATQESAALGAQKVRIGDLEAEAIEFHVEIVFDGKGQRVGLGEIEIAGSDQVVHAGGIVEVGGLGEQQETGDRSQETEWQQPQYRD